MVSSLFVSRFCWNSCLRAVARKDALEKGLSITNINTHEIRCRNGENKMRAEIHAKVNQNSRMCAQWKIFVF